MLYLCLPATRKLIFRYFRTVLHDGDVCHNVVTIHCNFVFGLIHNLKKLYTLLRRRCSEKKIQQTL